MDIKKGVEIVQALVPKIEEIVFVVGAGVSVTAGFPLWNKAASNALTGATSRGMSAGAVAHAQDLLAAKSFYQMFSVIKMSFPLATYQNIVTEAFDHPQSASETQKLLASVPGRVIITTNFDECLTAARVHAEGQVPQTQIPDILASDKYFITNPHGTLNQPGSMVLTTEDWQGVLQKGKLKQLLEQVINRNQVIFLGYSLSDPDWNSIWIDCIKDRVFRHPSIFCCSEGALADERIVALKDNNVQVVEFANDGSFAFVSAVLEGLLGHTQSAPTTPVGTTLEDTIMELERYVSLCLEFSESRQSRLILVLKAIILEMLAERQHSASQKEMLAFIVTILGEHSESLTKSLSSALALLTAERAIQMIGERYLLEENAKKELSNRVKVADSKETETLERLLKAAAIRHNVAYTDLSLTVLRELVDHALIALGITVAEFFLYGKPAILANEALENIVNSWTARELARSQRNSYSDALKRFVIQPSSEDEAVVFRRLQSYFITSAFVLSPTSDKLLADYAKGHIIYLDASVILPALANGHPSQPLYRGLLADTRRLGMQLRVSREMLNETFANVGQARSAFYRYGHAGLDIEDVLAGYVLVQGRGNGNVFLEGFLSQLELDKSLTPDVYMKLVMDGGEPVSERQLAAVLKQRFDIDLDDLLPAEHDKAEIIRLTESIAHLRKQGNRFKTELLCKHEAIQFYLLHLRRTQNPELTSKIWFVTTDYFFVELQRLERDRYPLPVSYTPRLWFQYLDLIDTDARGSKNFARLQGRMRYGVATGELGMAAIDLIVKEKKDLIARGLVTVKEMAQAIVDNYHVRNAIDSYEYASRTGVSVTRKEVKDSISRAVTGLVTLRVQEIYVLKSEKQEALDLANILGRKLEKEKYTSSYLKRGLPKRKKDADYSTVTLFVRIWMGTTTRWVVGTRG